MSMGSSMGSMGVTSATMRGTTGRGAQGMAGRGGAGAALPQPGPSPRAAARSPGRTGGATDRVASASSARSGLSYGTSLPGDVEHASPADELLAFFAKKGIRPPAVLLDGEERVAQLRAMDAETVEFTLSRAKQRIVDGQAMKELADRFRKEAQAMGGARLAGPTGGGASAKGGAGTAHKAEAEEAEGGEQEGGRAGSPTKRKAGKPFDVTRVLDLGGIVPTTSQY